MTKFGLHSDVFRILNDDGFKFIATGVVTDESTTKWLIGPIQGSFFAISKQAVFDVLGERNLVDQIKPVGEWYLTRESAERALWWAEHEYSLSSAIGRTGLEVMRKVAELVGYDEDKRRR